ncbi:MAG: cytochrome-c peroxidase [Flaviaesturariibacter sp.]|nr:cytochrome-c peroxidase [Flaviaesturariibacter sp.]
MRVSSVITSIIVLIVASILLLESCRKKDRSFYKGTPLAFTIPAGFPQPVYDFAANPLTEEAFLLGRKLFYEGRLSVDSFHACASCHQPDAAFTTFEHDLSHGVHNAHTLRNAPGLSNLAWYPAFMQDGRFSRLESVSLYHINAPNEMDENLPAIVERLKADTVYHRLFTAAYGDKYITNERLLEALKQFVLGMVSANAKYDKVKRGEASFTATEQSGYAIFQSKCAACHKEPLFTDFSYRNIGLPLAPGLKDFGRMRVTGNSADSLKFRVPSLRNVMFTSYYSHDGRFSFVQRLLSHYRSGVVPSSTLDPLLAAGIQTTTTEETALIAFLRTLSDSSFLNNPRYRQ